MIIDDHNSSQNISLNETKTSLTENKTEINILIEEYERINAQSDTLE